MGGTSVYIPPLTPDQPPLKAAIYVKQSDDGDVGSLQVLFGEQLGGGGKRGKSLGFDIELCSDEGLKSQWNALELTYRTRERP